MSANSCTSLSSRSMGRFPRSTCPGGRPGRITRIGLFIPACFRASRFACPGISFIAATKASTRRRKAAALTGSSGKTSTRPGGETSRSSNPRTFGPNPGAVFRFGGPTSLRGSIKTKTGVRPLDPFGIPPEGGDRFARGFTTISFAAISISRRKVDSAGRNSAKIARCICRSKTSLSPKHRQNLRHNGQQIFTVDLDAAGPTHVWCVSLLKTKHEQTT